MNIDNHKEEFIEQGYTIIKSVFKENFITEWQSIAKECHHNCFQKKLYGRFFETHPDLTLKTISNSVILSFIELIWGPFIQLDGFTLVISPPTISNEINNEKGISWHRDPYSYIPYSTYYERPLAINLLIYLQDLTDITGPLRIIPKTHRESFTLSKHERFTPHSREKLLYMKSGEAILLHTNLIHSRSPNYSNEFRDFLSIFYNLSFLKSTLNKDSEEIKKIILNAKKHNDKRTLRLFGIDEKFIDRTHGTGMEDEITIWTKWINQDNSDLIPYCYDRQLK